MWFQFEDDSEEMHDRRTKQSNLFGPAGYVAMEDAEVMESTQQMIARGLESGSTFMEMGGRDVQMSGSHGVTETSLRGFWQAYCKYMEIPTPSRPGGRVRRTTMTDMEIEYRITRLNNEYVQCIDEDRLEEWPGFFLEGQQVRHLPT